SPLLGQLGDANRPRVQGQDRAQPRPGRLRAYRSCAEQLIGQQPVDRQARARAVEARNAVEEQPGAGSDVPRREPDAGCPNRVAGRHPEAGVPRRPGEGRRDRVQDEDRARDPRPAQHDPLVEGRNAEPVGARRLERAGDRDRAVAVRVGLYDREQRRPVARELAQHAKVAGEEVEVDLGPGSPREGWQARRREAVLDSLPGRALVAQADAPSPSRTANPTRLPGLPRSAIAARRLRTSGTASGRSEASNPASPNRSRTRSPAVPCRNTPSRAAGPGLRPCARSPPITPESTSPVPPVARPGFSNGATVTVPSGSAITVFAPLSTTT